MSFVRRWLTAFTFTAVALAPAAVAQAPAKGADQAGGLRVAFINASALLRGMPGYAQAESTYAKEAEVAQQEALKIRTAWDSLVANYQQGQAMMTPSNRTAREKQLNARGDTVQAQLQAIQARVQNRERELLSPMQERLKSIIDGIRAEGNYAMIIDLGSDASSNIVSFDKSLDITLRVAQRLTQTN
ncbi:MAG: OmpH family outer membrane protein [Gemmatimonadales bacterium]